MRAVITVIGTDTMGIIARVSGYLAENQINILDISQTIMQDLFTMIMLVDLDKTKIAFDTIADGLDRLAVEVGVTIRIQHEDIFQSMHRI